MNCSYPELKETLNLINQMSRVSKFYNFYLQENF